MNLQANLAQPKPNSVWSVNFGGNPTKGEVPKTIIESKKNLQILVDEDKQQIIILEGK